MAHHSSYRSCQRKVKVGIPMAQNRVFVQNLKKGDRLVMPPGCTVMDEPERLPDDLFKKYEFMSTEFRKLPYAAIGSGLAKEEDIQKILHHSLKQQKEEDVAYSPGFVCTVVKECLNAIDVPCTLEMGYRAIEKDSTAHAWLKIDNVVIDNTYEKYLTKHQISFLENSTPKCYLKRDCFLYAEDMKDDRDVFSQMCIKKGVEIFVKEPDKGIALGLNQEPLYLYFFAMVRFMLDSFSVHLRCMDPSVRHYCWGCGIFPMHSRELLTDILPEGYEEVKDDSYGKLQGKFRHCSQCMVSNYCSAGCQATDWEEQHIFLCVSRVAGPASEY